MANKKVASRMQQKIDTSANWALATTFVPLKGEVIVYSDKNRIKIGDGVSTVGALSFVKGGGDEVRTNSTMLASNWVSNTYSFESEYPSSSYNISIALSSTATETELKAFSKAGLTGSINSNVLTAIGTVPTINIPIIITATPV